MYCEKRYSNKYELKYNSLLTFCSGMLIWKEESWLLIDQCSYYQETQPSRASHLFQNRPSAIICNQTKANNCHAQIHRAPEVGLPIVYMW